MIAAMLQLHWFPGNASMTPHVLLEELGAPYTLAIVDRKNNAHKSPAYLALNPNGLIPTLVDGAQVLYETGAIVLHLADTHPQAGLAPAPGSAARPEFLKWLFWLSSSVQPYMTHYFYGDRMVAPGNAEGAAQVKAALERRLHQYAGKPVRVLVRTAAELARILAADPFPEQAPNRTVVIFLDDAPAADALATVSRQCEERVALGEREIYVDYGAGMADSKLRIPAGEAGTGRNMNTVARLAAMAAALDAQPPARAARPEKPARVRPSG